MKKGSQLAPGEEECLRIESLSQEAFVAFKSQQWDKARIMYSELGGKHGRLMLERIDFYESNPPSEDWDGLTILNSK